MSTLYGQGERGVVLAHGGPFTKESWAKQAPVLVKAGFRVVAIDFRGRGRSRGGTRASASSLSSSSSSSLSSDEGYRFDVLAAVRYLRSKGAKSVSVVGASFGADAAVEAAVANP